jgi:transcriptional regulator with XRE-family HTH domain
MKTGNTETIDTTELINLLIQCRAERSLTIPDVAKALKMSTGSISNIERGVGKPRRTTIAKLEQFLRKHGYFPKKAA